MTMVKLIMITKLMILVMVTVVKNVLFFASHLDQAFVLGLDRLFMWICAGSQTHRANPSGAFTFHTPLRPLVRVLQRSQKSQQHHLRVPMGSYYNMFLPNSRCGPPPPQIYSQNSEDPSPEPGSKTQPPPPKKKQKIIINKIK